MTLKKEEKKEAEEESNTFLMAQSAVYATTGRGRKNEMEKKRRGGEGLLSRYTTAFDAQSAA